ncbi:hypothetical protein N9M28_04975 [Luminiphilus sp.]|nr:hypothetical protein [Luminiphilus sp.]
MQNSIHIAFGALLSLGILGGLGFSERAEAGVGDAIIKASSEGAEVDSVYIAGIGDAVLKLSKRECMPNAFGKCDIFGRKRDVGTTSLIFVGARDGKAMLVRRDLDIHSTKTTMNSTGIYSSNSSTTRYSGMAGGSMFSGTANTTGGGTYIPPNTPMDQMAGSQEVLIGLAPNERTLIEGYLVTLVSVSESMIQFEWKKLKD